MDNLSRNVDEKQKVEVKKVEKAEVAEVTKKKKN